MRFFLEDQLGAGYKYVVHRSGCGGRHVLLLRHNCRGFEQPGKRLLEYRFQCSDSCTVVCNGTSFNRPAGTATRGRPMRRRLPSSLSSLQRRSDRGQRKRAGLRRTIVGAVTSRETHARLHRCRSGDFLASRRSHCVEDSQPKWPTLPTTQISNSCNPKTQIPEIRLPQSQHALTVGAQAEHVG